MNKSDGAGFFGKTLEFQIWSHLCHFGAISALIQDFRKNGSKNFFFFAFLDEPNNYLSNAGGPMFRKTLDLELWIDS